MPTQEKISDFLLALIEDEHLCYKKNDVDATTKFVYLKFKEVYSMITRWLGVAHLHDRTRKRRRSAPPRPVLTDDQLSSPARWDDVSPRVLIDVTPTYRYGGNTGIQRVVREIAVRAFDAASALPVIIEDGQILSYFVHPSLPSTVEVLPGDKFVMLDATWNLTEEYAPIIRRITDNGGEIIVGLHDITPLLYPNAVSRDMAKQFHNWLENVVLNSNAILCVSAWTAMTLNDYMGRHRYPVNPSLSVGWWRLGADFRLQFDSSPSSRAVELTEKETPFFLSVGTLEPRKAYSVALSAFDKLWKAGVDVRYVIVGREGWLSYALLERIKQHPECGRKLLWLRHADDADLLHYYNHARALVCTSIAEGFGLPVVEALHEGLPVIATDIPVFHEISGDDICYFDLLDDDSLVKQLRSALERPKTPRDAKTYSWRDSTNNLIDLIRKDRYQLQLFGRTWRVADKDDRSPVAS